MMTAVFVMLQLTLASKINNCFLNKIPKHLSHQLSFSMYRDSLDGRPSNETIIIPIDDFIPLSLHWY